MIPLFLADSMQQADFWARELGFHRRDWRYLRDIHDCFGYRGDEVTVYVVGTELRADQYELLDELAARRLRIVWAEEMAHA